MRVGSQGEINSAISSFYFLTPRLMHAATYKTCNQLSRVQLSRQLTSSFDLN